MAHTNITKDEKGRVRKIDRQPTGAAGDGKQAPETIAARFCKKNFEIETVHRKGIAPETVAERIKARSKEDELWFQRSRRQRNAVVVDFDQFHNGIKVWRSGTTVLMAANSGEVHSATNTFDYDLPRLKMSASKLDEYRAGIGEETVAKRLLIAQNRKRLETMRKSMEERGAKFNAEVLEAETEIRILNVEDVIYRYDPDRRKHRRGDENKDDRSLAERALDLSIGRVDKAIKAGDPRVAGVVDLEIVQGPLTVPIQMIVDYETSSVLRFRVQVDFADASAWVYEHDPITTTGDATILPSSPLDVLNVARTPRCLPTVTTPNLSGQYVALQEICPITSAAPTSTAGRFDFDANTDDFSAANAYYHSDAVFRMVEEMGFDMATYFDGTSFPVAVDHRGSFACVNAAAWGNAAGNGLGSFTYGLIDAAAPVGIATDVRVVLHEFGHAILWDNVSSPNFGFAHSCGDSLAAVLCDPRSLAPDRFLTFPWVAAIPRRHDRDITSGWAWRGANDDGGYDSEQILSTSHFRAYRSLGGDHCDLCEREWAARYVAYLMIHGVGLLTPASNPTNPEAWSDLLRQCDRLTDSFEGHPGGSTHKVIRWAFEMQGAYQPAGAPSPVTQPGAPPYVDVYIDDGRRGEYPFTKDWCHTADIWNRNCPDGHPAHQMPIPGIDNYAYAIVRNRGEAESGRGAVKAFHRRDNACCSCCNDCHELRWPNDLIAMTTDELPLDSIPAGDYTIVGPFTWRPQPGDCMMMAVETEPDPSNLAIIPSGQSLLTKRLVPFDNNIGLRCVCPQCNPDYSKLELPCAEPWEPPRDPRRG